MNHPCSSRTLHGPGFDSYGMARSVGNSVLLDIARVAQSKVLMYPKCFAICDIEILYETFSALLNTAFVCQSIQREI